MKAATGSFKIEHIEEEVQGSSTTEQSGLSRYALVAALVTVMFLLSSWSPMEGESAFHIGSGFLWFWVVGGLVTLALLFVATKRSN